VVNNPNYMSDMSIRRWRVRSIWISTGSPFFQFPWPIATFTVSDGGVELRAGRFFRYKWQVQFHDIQDVLFNGNAFFIIAANAEFGRVIGTVSISKEFERHLETRGVKYRWIPEDLKRLQSTKKRQLLVHYPEQ